MKIMTVVGARPQFIKAATVSRAFLEHPNVEEILVHTGQHSDANMSDVFFDEMSIPRPKHELGVSGGGHGKMTGRMLEMLEQLIEQETPDRVLVYGDTNSTLAGALAATKLHVSLAHVEAGLRSHNTRMPEEINRILTDRMSDLLFCPTDLAVRNLEIEGYRSFDVRIERVGDVMLDAALFYGDRARRPVELSAVLEPGNFALATVHRAENTDDPARLAEIVEALNSLHAEELPVVLPLHPRTRRRLDAQRLRLDVHVIEPVGYLEMVWLLKSARVVLTDSGGLQKEAWFFRRPCVTLRDETEWMELVDADANRIAGTDVSGIRRAVAEALVAMPDYDLELYGRGDAAQRVARAVLE